VTIDSIAVITPSYNQGRFIRRTIESVLNQHFGQLEYVVIDGGSTDETLDILREYGHRLRWVSEPDRGQADAVNKAIRTTTGAVIGWLNSDDVYYPAALQSVATFLDENPDVDVVYGDANHIDEADNIIEPFPTEAWRLDRLADVCFLAQPATFVRRQTVERCGLLDATVRYATDYDYWFRLALAGARFQHLPRLLAGTRLHAGAATIARRVACHAEINDITRKHLGRTPDRWLLNYAHAVVDGRAGLRTGNPVATLMLATVALYAAVRWNGRISTRMSTTLLRWLASDFSRPLRQRANLT
jgi:glycosyltransferase involved in cell wall biosynthesis